MIVIVFCVGQQGGGDEPQPSGREMAAMKRVVLLVSLVAVMSAVAAGVAWAAVIACPTGAGGVCAGTSGDDTLNGKPGY
jgi:hypothetical protein